MAYGPHAEQVGDLTLPPGGGPHPVVVLWHGGGFAAEYGRDMLAPAAADLAARGWAAWNVTYRRFGSGGGWPQSFDDARLALAHVAELGAPLDLDDVTVLGFSAGFPLAVHAARSAGPVRAQRLVNLTGISLLEVAARGGGPTSSPWELLGDPDDVPGAYAGADPAANVPLGLPSLTVHGDADVVIPPAMSESWVQRRREAGDEAELVVVPGAGHFDVHLPGSTGWDAVVDWLGAHPADATGTTNAPA